MLAKQKVFDKRRSSFKTIAYLKVSKEVRVRIAYSKWKGVESISFRRFYKCSPWPVWKMSTGFNIPLDVWPALFEIVKGIDSRVKSGFSFHGLK